MLLFSTAWIYIIIKIVDNVFCMYTKHIYGNVIIYDDYNIVFVYFEFFLLNVLSV